ncbi:hypothetical protein M430DRAFT_178029 [Amorphotheca resinae ATCC 22711]|uniref:Uncharacterized protein n=1 Tax=Amorphotheca resinae ATCC 22711 TaxID=857342 RepID=A0A2T3AT87_AMORE|nr:hypothetical protein M430DRAFT_178029 [Amorphotheca resinae ATCC 22711]PSS10705.1 hypothetical protein M430DRAFT_178029 [Amorphotheca resinae ATCC 22711]
MSVMVCPDRGEARSVGRWRSLAVPRRGGEKGGCDRTVLQRCRDCRRQPSRGSPAIDSGGEGGENEGR